jgi:hypothetical protein
MNDWKQELSDAAMEILRSGADQAYARLVVVRAPSGAASGAIRGTLAGLTPTTVLRAPATSHDDAHALIAGLWLWHDFLEESHNISQGIPSLTGSFWHAIMHRREGDFSNAKYWYARCRQHPVRGELDLSGDALVDLVERVHEQPDDPQHARAVAAQRAEWNALFAHCVRAAQK